MRARGRASRVEISISILTNWAAGRNAASSSSRTNSSSKISACAARLPTSTAAPLYSRAAKDSSAPVGDADVASRHIRVLASKQDIIIGGLHEVCSCRCVVAFRRVAARGVGAGPDRREEDVRDAELHHGGRRDDQEREDRLAGGGHAQRGPLERDPDHAFLLRHQPRLRQIRGDRQARRATGTRSSAPAS